MRILTVDSSRIFQQLVRSQASHLGCEVDCCNNAEDAMEALDKHHYDLITIARFIEPVNYEPLLKHIRTVPRCQFTPVLLIASDYDFNFVKEAVGQGVTDVLSRNSPNELIEGIRRCLRKSDYRFDARVMLVEDSELNGQLVSSMLSQRGMDVHWFKNYADGAGALAFTDYDLIITDLLLDEKHTGLELLHLIRHHEDPSISNTPVVAMTGFNDPSRRLLAFHLGADDYVSKPFSEEELLVRIDRVLTRNKLVMQLQKREAQLTEMALFDALTGVYNRHGLKELMKNRITACQNTDTPAVLMVLDLDHFKELNDSFGHPFGDTILHQVGETLNDIVRDNDIAGRWGGDEFIVLLTNCDLEDAKAIAERVRVKLQHRNHRIQCSIGLSAIKPDDTLESFMERSDKALYEAKKNNKGGFALL